MSSEAMIGATSSTDDLANFRKVYIWGNWGVNRRGLPHFLIKGRGAQLEPIVKAFSCDVASKRIPQVRQGWAWDARSIPGQVRPLRIVYRLGFGHNVATDVNFQAQGEDLYVRFGLVAWTLITLAGRILSTAACTLLLAVFVSYFWNSTRAYDSWVRDFARKWAQRDVYPHSDNAAQLENAIKYGVSLGRSFPLQGGNENLSLEARRVIEQANERTYEPPWTKLQLFRADPQLALSSLGGWPALFLGAVWLVLMFFPTVLLHYPCLWLRWPTPEMFRNTVAAHCAWVEGVLSDTLWNQFQVDSTQRIPINNQ